MAYEFKDHSAYAQSIFGLQKNEKAELHLLIGKTDDEIVSPRGQKTLVYLDGILVLNQTVVAKHMPKWKRMKKNKISHRGKSSKALIDFVKKNDEIFQ